MDTLTMAGGNLFALAAARLGDATQWNRIAAQNGLLDPMLAGVVTLVLPDALPVGSGGGVAAQ